jgi:GMP reductase
LLLDCVVVAIGLRRWTQIAVRAFLCDTHHPTTPSAVGGLPLRIERDPKLDFKDVLIRPKRSTLSSRAEVDIRRAFRFVHARKEWTGFPLIASNMDTTGTMSMARAFAPFGAMVALHKHYPADKLVEFFHSEAAENVFCTMGTTEADQAKFADVKSKAAITKISLDVANGYTEMFLEVVARTREANPDAVIMAGTIVTGEMAEALILAGADIVRVGIGSGSVCTTRDLTGVGYPQLSAVIECADAAHGLKGHVCSDGGCTVPGDIGKAFGGGADFVMLGGMLAGHEECEGEVRYEDRGGERVATSMQFYGMSSDTAMNKYYGGVAEYRASEGKTVEVPYRGSVKATMQEITGGLRSMMTYIGATKLKEVPKRTTFVMVGAQRNTVFDH